MADKDTNEYNEFLRGMSVEDIEKQYHDGDISAQVYVNRTRSKARLELSQLEQGSSFMSAVWQQTAKNFMEGWNTIVDDAAKIQKETKEKLEDPSLGNLVSVAGAMQYERMKALWGTAQMVFAVLGSGLGDVTGMRIENNALRQGYSAGAARVLGIAADVASGAAIPIGAIARSVGAVGKAAAGTKVMSAIAGDVSNDARWMRAIAEGMALDGVDDAVRVVDKVAKQAGKPTLSKALGLDEVATKYQALKDAIKATKPNTPEAIVAEDAFATFRRSEEFKAWRDTKIASDEAAITALYRTKPASQIQREMAPLSAKLPAELAGAKPRYNFGDKSFTPEFESDVDKALYIVAQRKPSAQDAKYMEWLKKLFPEHNPSEIRGMGQAVRSKIKIMARTAEPDSTLTVKTIDRSRPELSFVDTAKQFAKDISLEDAKLGLPDLMKKFGISYPDLKTIKAMWTGSGKQAMNAQEFYGYLKAMELRSEELAQLAKRAIAEGATSADQHAFARAVTELFTGPKEKLQYSKEFTELLLHWDPKNVASGNLEAAMRTFATDIAQLSPKQIGKLSFNNQDGFVRFGQITPRTRELFVNILLPMSVIPSFVSNSIGAATLILERVVSGHPMEAAHMMKSMAWATADATRAFGMAFATSGARGAIPGIVGRAVRVPSDSLIAMDAAFKVIVTRASLYGDALRASQGAANPGRFIRNFMDNPPGQAVEDATERAYRATYQNDLGQFMSNFRNIAQSGPGTFYFTFIKSPINLVKFDWDRTPGLQALSGRLWHDLKSGGTLADDAMARLTMSQLQAMMVWEFAKEGFITGGGPVDPALRKAWLAVHQPYSIKTSTGWVPYLGAAPATMPIALVADIAQIADQLDSNSLEQLSMAAAFSFMRNVANRTSWRTMSELVDVAQGRMEGERWTRRNTVALAGPALAFLTGGSIVSSTEAITDPVMRDARTLYEQYAKRVPGYSENVSPLRDGYGDPIIPPTAIGTPWFGYMHPLVPKLRPHETDPVKLEGARVQATLPSFPDFVGMPPRDDLDISNPLPGSTNVGVGITSAQRDRWQQLYRNVIRHPDEGLAALINSEEYKSWPLARQRAEFNAAVADAKALARENLLIEDVELGKAVLTNDMNNVLPLEEPADRPEVVQDYTEARDLLTDMNEEEKDNITKFGFLEPDQPKTQSAVEILGVEILGERKYEPKTPAASAPKALGVGPQ